MPNSNQHASGNEVSVGTNVFATIFGIFKGALQSTIMLLTLRISELFEMMRGPGSVQHPSEEFIQDDTFEAEAEEQAKAEAKAAQLAEAEEIMQRLRYHGLGIII